MKHCSEDCEYIGAGKCVHECFIINDFVNIGD